MKHTRAWHKRPSGFTLIELMVTVAIVAILAAIAVPSYQEYVTRGKIPDATSTLASKRVQMEQYFQDNHTYVDAPACTSDSSTSRYFTFDCSVAGTATAYTLRATGSGTMAGFVYTIDQDNNKVTTSVPSGWTTNNSCWVTKKDGSC
jgi:type IV pilus assembly protein PilE